MKKLTAIILSALCLALASAKSAEPVLVSETPCEYRTSFIRDELSGYNARHDMSPRFVSTEGLADDIDILEYYFKNFYMGYEDMCARGFNLDKMRSNFLKKYAGQSEIEVLDLYKDFLAAIMPFVRDNHFSILCRNHQDLQVYERQNIVYYTNTFVKGVDGSFFLCETDDTSLREGMKYNGSAESLFSYPAKGAGVFRLGVVSREKQTEFSVMFDGADFTLPVSADGVIFSDGKPKYHELESADSGYVSISNFMLPDEGSMYRKGAEIVLERYASLAAKWRDKKNIIIDLRGNAGGYSIYSEYLLWSLYYGNKKPFTEKNYDKICHLDDFFRNEQKDSPAVIDAIMQATEQKGNITEKKILEKYLNKMKKNPVLRVYRSAESKPLAKSRDKFKGNIIILTDRKSTSAAEYSVADAKFLFGNQAVIVGEPTAGCLEFGGVYTHLLPNSQIAFRIGYIRDVFLNDFPQWHGEGKGFYPDYWTSGDDLNETIFLVTGDEEMREKLDGISERLM